MKKTHKRLALASAILVAISLLLLGRHLLLYEDMLPQTRPHKLTLADFDFVRLGMGIDEIGERLGSPEERAVHMYQYELVDDSLLILRMDLSEQVRGIWILRKDGTRVDFFTGEAWPELSVDDFDFLWPYMLYNEVIKRVGEPHIESGYGVHSAVYKLADGGAVVLDLGTPLLVTGPMPIIANAWITSEGTLVNLFDNK